MTKTTSTDEEIYDLDVIAAEAEDKPFRFRLGGDLFTLPNVQQIDRKDLNRFETAMAAMDVDNALRLLLADQWELFDAQAMNVRQLEALFKKYMAQQGLAPGESEASTSS